MNPTWKTIPNTSIRNVWRDKITGEEVQIHPDFYQNNGTPSDDQGGDMEYVRTEIIDETSTQEQSLELQEYSDIVGGPSGATRTALLGINPEGIRMTLHGANRPEKERPDVYLEANPDGWKVCVHANQDEEPFAVIRIEDNGQHEVSFREENIPALA